jgi:hypothetical protein
MNSVGLLYHDIPPLIYCFAKDQKAMEPEPWNEASEIVRQNEPFLHIRFFYLRHFVTAVES